MRAGFSGYPEPYDQFRSRKFGDKLKAAVGDYNLKIRQGAIPLPPPNIRRNIPDQSRHIDFSEKFSVPSGK